jgi:hypothetical protein
MYAVFIHESCHERKKYAIIESKNIFDDFSRKELDVTPNFYLFMQNVGISFLHKQSHVLEFLITDT